MQLDRAECASRGVHRQPEKTDELRGLLCQAVTPLLRDRTGFIRSIVSDKHEEPRRIVVITFWSTEERTVSDPWEESPIVRRNIVTAD